MSAGAAPRAVLAKPATGTHFVAERSFKSRLTVTLAGHMVTGALAADAVWTGLATAVAEETRRTDALAGGSSESRRALARALVRGAGRPVLTVTGQGAVRPPAALGTHAVAVNACPAGQTAAVSR